MMDRRIVLSCYFLCLVSGSEAQGNCAKDLVNQVVYLGNSTTFNIVDDGGPGQWQMNAANDYTNSLQDITNNNTYTITPQFIGVYDVNRTALNVFNATTVPQAPIMWSTAGIYVFTYEDTHCITAANLVVIQSGPICTSDATDPNNVIMSCSVNYAESSIQQNYPEMTWTTDTGTVVVQNDRPTPVLDSNNNIYNSTSTITTTGAGPSSFTCQLTFSATDPFPIGYLSTNAPTFSASCSVANPLAEDTTTTRGDQSTAITKPATEDISTTTTCRDQSTGVCIDRPNCESKWLTPLKQFCNYTPEFRDDCPAFCNAC